MCAFVSLKGIRYITWYKLSRPKAGPHTYGVTNYPDSNAARPDTEATDFMHFHTFDFFPFC